jgi:hypothetical protein
MLVSVQHVGNMLLGMLVGMLTASSLMWNSWGWH